jgi:hypothetical protein
MAHDLFISYAHEDKPAADAVCAGLEGVGVRCWIAPRDIVPGSEWGGAIIEAINSSRLLVVVFSAHSNGSKQVLREVERAVHRELPILPFRIAAIKPSGSMEYFLATPHWLDALTPPLEQHIQSLARNVKVLLNLGKPDEAPRTHNPSAPTPEVPPDQWGQESRGFLGRVKRWFLDRDQ